VYIQSDLGKPITGSQVSGIYEVGAAASVVEQTSYISLTHDHYFCTDVHKNPQVGRPTDGCLYFIVEMKGSLLVYL